MKLLIGIFIIIIVLLITSKFKINVKYLGKDKNFNLDIKLDIYLFEVIKIVGISLKSDGIYFLFFKFPYPKMRIHENNIRILYQYLNLNFIKDSHIKLENLDFRLEIGCEDVMVTIFIVTMLSSILSILPMKNIANINSKNYYYKITPIYNSNKINFRLITKISCKIFYLMRAIRKIKKINLDEKNGTIQRKIALSKT